MVWLLACAPADDSPFGSGTDPDGSVEDTAPAGCPEGMATFAGRCIDAVEVTMTGEAGNTDQGPDFPDGSTTAVAEPVRLSEPTTNVTWYQAYAACANVGKHLCTWPEWRDVCDRTEGEGGTLYPWGTSGAPNERCALANPDGTTNWDGLVPAGALPDCTDADDAVYDLIGNAWEWVDLQEVAGDGTPVTGKVGGAWYVGYSNGSCDESGLIREHPPDFEGTIGFRCCVGL